VLSRYYLTLWFVQLRHRVSLRHLSHNLLVCHGLLYDLGTGADVSYSEMRLLVATGFLGSYTTFSTYGLDTITLLSNHRLIPSVLYWAGSALIGILSVQLGVLARLGS